MSACANIAGVTSARSASTLGPQWCGRSEEVLAGFWREPSAFWRVLDITAPTQPWEGTVTSTVDPRLYETTLRAQGEDDGERQWC